MISGNIFLSAIMYIQLWCLVIISVQDFIADASNCSLPRRWEYDSTLWLDYSPPACKLTRVPDKSFATIQREIISLTISAHIEIIDPGAFSVFHILKSLSLYDNCIKWISSNTFFNLTQLERLSLAGNQIR